MPKSNTCACGCGEPLPPGGSRYLPGHTKLPSGHKPYQPGQGKPFHKSRSCSATGVLTIEELERGRVWIVSPGLEPLPAARCDSQVLWERVHRCIQQTGSPEGLVELIEELQPQELDVCGRFYLLDTLIRHKYGKAFVHVEREKKKKKNKE